MGAGTERDRLGEVMAPNFDVKRDLFWARNSIQYLSWPSRQLAIDPWECNRLYNYKRIYLKRYKVRKKYANISRHIQFINDVSDVLHLSSGCNSGLQNFD